MIDDVTESMNSNKFNTIYEIQTKSLEKEQLPFEIQFFKYECMVDIETPIFSDKKDVEINTILTLFNNGIITLGETIKAIIVYFPAFELEYNNVNPLFNERYYNGRLLGTNEYSQEDIDQLDGVMA